MFNAALLDVPAVVKVAPTWVARLAAFVMFTLPEKVFTPLKVWVPLSRATLALSLASLIVPVRSVAASPAETKLVPFPLR